ncbi:hypothetical protein AN478_05790 [Thiohalorhabdus denitrificans]|uniref:Putative hydrolase of the HAD superfamily n=1 Tax=Thiohalorhabdus denitrificans TaxID=381306 RepID=A0A0N8PN66_9GAMM|nr:HAD family hydrolase [Thiohalorhabdus denitrificans]KPV40669.1 hypothetical protein AN478_05790 [Thiohalorhabdus denitrificans]SCY47481.1 putative hydrolase of the HAD superfamily [Thiohalorhabdus denitrificans]
MEQPQRALTFDLDETLWPCEDVIARAEGAVYRWLATHCPRITAEYGQEEMRAIRLEMAERHPDLAADMTALRVASLRWHAERAGYAPGVAEAAMEVFLAERNRVTPFEEVPGILERLGARFPLVALTNGNAHVPHTPLAGMFDLVLSAGDVGAPKPHPAMFRAACGELGLPATALVHMGDDPVRDVQAARDLGARTVWINRAAASWPDGLARPHHELPCLRGLPALLEDGGA